MTSPMTYEQLDQALEVMLTARDGALPTLDRDTSEMLAVAAELRNLPRPEFRAALEKDLRYALGLPLLHTAAAPPAPEVHPETALPTLFGGGPETYPVRRAHFVLSLAAHAAAVALVVTSAGFVAQQLTTRQNVVTVISPADIGEYVLPVGDGKSGGGGGGGDRDKLEASRGALPRAAMSQLTPPSAVVRNPDPALAAEPTVVVPPHLVSPENAVLGDPMSRVVGPPSNGTGSGGGMGSGSGGGVGSGTGPGVGPGFGGGIGGGVFRVGGGVSAPRVVYAPDPEYSEEARKAKYQGTVVLWTIIDAQGRVRDTRVVRSLGMGLDERAVAAVRTWRFEPAMKDGRPVPVQVNIEVHFRLY